MRYESIMYPVWVLICVPVLLSAEEAAKAPVDPVVAAIQVLPAKDWATATKTFDALLKPEAIQKVLGLLTPPGPPNDNDIKARFALHGLARYVLLPKLSDTQRRMLCETLSAHLATDAHPEVKRFVVRQLQVAGGPFAIEALARCVADKELGEPTTQALIRIGDAKAVAAIRAALPKAEPASQKWIAQALGVLRDTQSVGQLLKLTKSDDTAVQLTAFEALGNIGDESAVDTFLGANVVGGLYERSRLTNATLVLSQRLAEARQSDRAAKVCRHLWASRTQSDERHIRCAALSGLLAAIGDKAMVELLAAMDSQFTDVRAAALDLALTLPGRAVTKQWVNRLNTAKPETRVQIMDMLAKRGDKAAFAVLVTQMQSEDLTIKAAAVDAARRLGGTDAIAPLIQLANKDAAAGSLVTKALARIQGESVDASLSVALKGSNAPARVSLLDALGERVASSQVGAMRTYAGAEEAEVRSAAVSAIGKAGGDAETPFLLGLLLKREGRELKKIEEALIGVCTRSGDKGKAANAVKGSYAKAQPAGRCALLRVLGRIGHGSGLEQVRSALSDKHQETADTAVRVLASWPNAAPIDELFGIAEKSKNVKHKVLALRGYIQMVEKTGKPVKPKLERYGKAMAIALRPEEKRMVLGCAGNLKAAEALTFLEPFLDDEQLSPEAGLAVTSVARSIRKKQEDTAIAALAKVVEKTKSDHARKEAKKLLTDMLKNVGYVKEWLHSKRFTEGSGIPHNVVFAPEKPDAKDVEWKKTKAKDGRIQLHKILGGKNCGAYLKTNVYSPKTQKVRMELGSDDQVKVWLNGKLVHQFAEPRSFKFDEDKLEVELNEGWNTLMLKVCQGGGGWETACRFLRPSGARLRDVKFSTEVETEKPKPKEAKKGK